MDVIVVGSSNVDLISYVQRVPNPGETIFASKFQVGFGGKGANQCIAASKLSAKTGMISKVGSDTFGQDYLQNYKSNNISTEHVTVTTEKATGTATIVVDNSGQNSIIVAPGANSCLCKEDVENAEDLIKKSKVVVCQFEIDMNVTLEALKLSKKHGAVTILNPAPAESHIHTDLYKYSDYFVPNETEAEILTGIKVSDLESARKAGNILLDRGCKNVIITLGENGSLYGGQDRQFIHSPAEKTEVMDSTGAGDAYIGALAYYLSCHPDLEMKEKLDRAGRVATVSVQSPGTQSSYAEKQHLPTALFS